MTTDGSLLPSGAGRFDASPCVLAARLGGRPRNRSSSSPRRRMLSDVPDGHGPKETHWGGAFSPRGSTARWTSRAWKALGDSRGRAAGPDNLPDDTPRRAPALRTWSWFVQPGEKACHKSRPPGRAAGDCSPVTAPASRMAERRPSVDEGALSYLVQTSDLVGLIEALASTSTQKSARFTTPTSRTIPMPTKAAVMPRRGLRAAASTWSGRVARDVCSSSRAGATPAVHSTPRLSG